MTRRSSRSIVTALLPCFLALLAMPAFAQNASSKSALSGLVLDTGGGVIPGATVVVKNTATGVSTNTITNASGAFNVPALDAGTYSVTVSLSGFKTVVVSDVVLVVGNPGSVKVSLEVGNVEQKVEVKGGTELVQTSATSVTSTISAAQINNLPLTSRNVLFGFVTMLPGVDTPGAPRDSKLFGLPEQSINISIDGVNTNNNFQRDTDGFYSMVFPQLDAVEQVSVTGAAAGAESASGGSVAIRFVTRSGGNQYKGTAYYYFRHPALNTNYYFNAVNNLPKNRIILNQFGGSEGGPIKIPGLYTGNSAFFFFNYEEFRQPTSATRTRLMMTPEAQNGILRYNVTTNGVTSVRSVDVLALAAANGQLASQDPTIKALLAQIRASAEGTVPAGIGKISDQNDVNTQQLIYQAPGNYVNHLPTSRVDFNLSPKHRLTGSYWWQEINRFPDIQNNGETTFPDLPNVANYTSVRSVGSVTLRSTLGAQFVNELITGWQWSPGTFNSGVVASMFQNQDMFSLGIGGFPTPNNTGITSATRSTNPNTRHQDNWNINDTVNWLKGNHSMSFGGGFTRVDQFNDSLVVVPSITFGVQSSLDPADPLFTTANFPGASNTDLANGRALYAILTGRVTSVNANANIDPETNKYVYNGFTNVGGRMDEYSLFFQDSWKFKPTLTLNYGLAYVVQMPMVAGNDNFSTTNYDGFCGPYGKNASGTCNLFQVGGPQTGVVPQFVQYSANTKGYNTDLNNLAPNIGAAWRPNVQSGFLRTLLGDPEQATVRVGFSLTFDKPSMGDFFNIYSGNPGRQVNANRNNNTGSNFVLVGPGETWPVLFRDKSRLGPPAGIPDSPVYPITANTGSSLAIFDPNIQTPYTRSLSFGLQRALGRDMAIEVRYVGTRGKNGWTTENWNEVNVIENGFFNEFKLAMSNLQSAVNAGLCATPATCSFGYRGPGTGTSPLPSILAYLTGLPASAANDPASYSSAAALAGFTNTTLLGRLNPYNPQVLGNNSFTNDLLTTARINNALAAGLPSNFFQMNPAIGTNSDSIRRSLVESTYDSVVIDLRRRLTRGLLVTANYTWAHQRGQSLDTLHNSRVWVDSTSSVPSAFKMTANYEVPVGRGKRYGANVNSWVNGAIGGWTVNMTGRVQSGNILTQTGVQLVGMTEEELQKMYKVRINDQTKVITMLPDDVILNTRRAFSTSATTPGGYGSLGAPEGRYIAPASGPNCTQLYPGDCGPRNIFLTGPMFTRFDFSAKKAFPLSGKTSFQLEVDVLNIFGAINFSPTFNPGSGGTIFQVTSAYTDISGTYDPGGRLGQIVWRVLW
jgi:Carboxypeptidase regulatory-like domain